MSLAYEDFAQGVVRQQVEARGVGNARTEAKKLAGLTESVLNAERLYARFERLPGNRLSMIFHGENKPLLGDTVWAWLKERVYEEIDDRGIEKPAEYNPGFIWCEKGEELFALVGVAGHTVIYDSLVSAREIPGEFAQLQNAVSERCDGEPFIYVHGMEAQELGLSEDAPIQKLPVSLADGLDEDELVHLRPYNQALARLTATRRLAIFTGVGLLVLALAAGGLYYWRDRLEIEEAVIALEQELAGINTNLRGYLEQPDPGLLLAKLYKAHAEFSVLTFADKPTPYYWEVSALNWSDDDPGKLKLSTRFRGSEGALPAGLAAQTRRWAEAHGLEVTIRGADVLFALPVRVPVRDAAARSRVFYGDISENAGDPLGALGDALGENSELTLTQGGKLDETALYETSGYNLRFSDVHWDRETLRWLAHRLYDKPGFIETFSLRYNQGIVSGSVTLRTVKPKRRRGNPEENVAATETPPAG